MDKQMLDKDTEARAKASEFANGADPEVEEIITQVHAFLVKEYGPQSIGDLSMARRMIFGVGMKQPDLMSKDVAIDVLKNTVSAYYEDTVLHGAI